MVNDSAFRIVTEPASSDTSEKTMGRSLNWLCI